LLDVSKGFWTCWRAGKWAVTGRKTRLVKKTVITHTAGRRVKAVILKENQRVV
jgi:hypothetical protein